MKVLHVEADQAYARKVARLLSRCDGRAFDVTSCASVAEACRLLAAGNFDAALLALNLPDSKGLQGYKRLSRSFPGIPLLLLTGCRDRRLAEEAVASHGAAYLQKSEASGGVLLRSILYVAARKRNEMAVARAANALKAHSAVNAALLRCSSEEEYLKAAADIVAAACGYGLVAVIQAFDDEDRTARVRAQSGRPDLDLRARISTWAQKKVGAGVYGTAIRTARPCVCRDIRTDPRFRALSAAAVKDGLISGLGVPLLRDGKAVGAITAYSPGPTDYSREEIKRMSDLAADVAAGMEMFRARGEKAAAEKKMRRLNNALRARNTVNQALLESLTEKEYLDKVARLLAEDCGCVAAIVALCEEGPEKKLRLAAQAGCVKEDMGKWVTTWADDERGQGPTALAIRTGLPAVCRDVNADSSLAGIRGEARRLDMRSALGLPLFSRKRPFGAITVYSNEPDVFSEDEVALMADLARDVMSGLEGLRSRIEKEAAQRSLSEAGSDVNRMFEESCIPLVAWDGGKRIVKFNGAFAELTGHKPEEVIGSGLGSLLSSGAPGWDGDACRCAEVRVRLKGGGSRTLLWNSSRMRYSASEALSFGQAQDITDRKAAEELILRDNRELERQVADRSAQLLKTQGELDKSRRLSDIGMLASTVAHELRNPLAAITMAAFNIAQKAGGPQLDGHLRNIEKKVGEANQIINNLLFYSRIKEPQHELADLGQVLRECVRAARVAGPRGARPKITLEVPELLPLEADPVQLKEIFFNIVSNAIDAVHGAPGAAITVRAGGSAETAYAEVEDTGVGMDEETKQKAFDPFFTTKAKGTGLGLYVCKQLVDLHKGTMDISSAPGRGTTVRITLPRGA